MIANDILLHNIDKIPSGSIITLQSTIFYFVMGTSAKTRKRKRKK